MSAEDGASPKTNHTPYIHPSLASPSSSPASSPPSSPASSSSSSSSSPQPPPRQHTDSAVNESYGPPATGSRKRKATWSLYDLLPKRFRPDEEEEEQEEEKDMVNLVLQDNLVGLKKVIAKPTPMPFVEDRAIGMTSPEDRKDEAQNNPLYVAALINRVEAAKLLLAHGWRMAEDRTMLHKEDPYMKSNTPLGVAFEKKNSVLEVFREHLIELEEKYWSEENQKKRKDKEKEEQKGDDEEVDVVTALRVPKRLKRSNSRGHFELSLSQKVVAYNPGETGSSDLVDLVLENNIKELKEKVVPPPILVLEEEGNLTIEEREERTDENPLYVAAKIGREEAAEILLKKGWRMTEDRTRKMVDDLYLEGLTPLGVAYEKNFGVLDLFLNHIIDLEEGV
mmetsp:Transcript_29969/g.46405  ORF Transcript_29969/g.46405 Transcript_29969/m.46405 type:complete len:394 (-) Transcript_29969:79-1260(-)|eukprot:CAMPEP_0201519148 /NCGR_PEP_ID=MMETSP0161_2-20130828/9778_1 /ASSEMBLY_ACC=CAM_ASM_000251 /TAXON_ID=180227 /ORGANISM="Neoparamoeba aestuarina, Strain SoJaBio B1-5/56/2" /LENGTH=393 /DNA_ID=CAMNT_0047917099 /DNA_START=123 /DNA_END=1304 /DNA_ORIENTATION=-